MPSGFFALLDDVAGIAKLAAASLDDVAGTSGRVALKAAGVVVDDTAVTPRYVAGLTPDRELPMIGRITLGSLCNKLLILLPAALLLNAVAPWAVTPLLMLGGLFLCFEGVEKLVEVMSGPGAHTAVEAVDPDPRRLEEGRVRGAIRTDLVLSAEIMAISLAEVADRPLVVEAVVLALVGVAITLGVYGVVAVVVKVDDIGLHLAPNRGGAGEGARPRPRARHAARDGGSVRGRHGGDDLGRRRHPAPRDRGAGPRRAGPRARRRGGGGGRRGSGAGRRGRGLGGRRGGVGLRGARRRRRDRGRRRGRRAAAGVMVVSPPCAGGR